MVPLRSMRPIAALNKRYVFLIVAALLCAGVLVRLFGGVAMLNADLVYISGDDEEESLPELVPTPESTARFFYHAINSGDYEAAWSVSLEPDWIGDGSIAAYGDEVVPRSDGQSVVPPGWTDKETFVTRMIRELGKSGSFIQLYYIRAVRKMGDSATRMSFLADLNIEEVIPVTVTGNLLDASCSIFQWQKDLFVLRSGDSYRILLEGTKAKNAKYYQAWIADLEMLAERKAARQ